MSDAKRPDPKRRSPTSRPGRTGESKTRRRRSAAPSSGTGAASAQDRTDETSAADHPGGAEPADESAAPGGGRELPAVIEPIRRSILINAETRSEQRMGFTARRAAILAAVICVLTLTIAGPVRTYFAQRTEMKQLKATQEALRAQIADLEEQKAKLADPVFIAAQARERLGFVMPGDIPYQVQLPPSGATPDDPAAAPELSAPTGPWYCLSYTSDSPDAPPGADLRHPPTFDNK
uniref:FtsB family cell division protein n=1 Tax=Mycolicibacterium palauense TaxID=2034511 RepID=UPI0011459DF3